jgi:hypothetical protein
MPGILILGIIVLVPGIILYSIISKRKIGIGYMLFFLLPFLGLFGELSNESLDETGTYDSMNIELSALVIYTYIVILYFIAKLFRKQIKS